MTLKDAEEYYKRFDGQAFHMGRENPKKYHEFKAMQIPESQLAAWDKELLDLYFSRFKEDPGHVWWQIALAITAISRGRCDMESQVEKLLEEMSRLTDLSLETKTLILEQMAGSDSYGKTGGVYLICTGTKQSGRMKEVIHKITGVDSAEANKKAGVSQAAWSGRVPSKLSVNALSEEQYFQIAKQKYLAALQRFDKH